jgi:hypothetical protein
MNSNLSLRSLIPPPIFAGTLTCVLLNGGERRLPDASQYFPIMLIFAFGFWIYSILHVQHSRIHHVDVNAQFITRICELPLLDQLNNVLNVSMYIVVLCTIP